jgi:hypothetical protein
MVRLEELFLINSDFLSLTFDSQTTIKEYEKNGL